MSNITVACKLPHGLVLTVGGKSVTLAGSNSSRIIGGYGLTSVDKDFFDAWSKEFASFVPLKNGLIFAQDSGAKAEGQAREQADLKSGLEPLDIEKPAKGVYAEAFEGKSKAA